MGTDTSSAPQRKASDGQPVSDLEVKDAALIFNSIWQALEDDIGKENLRFPKEIFWLNGAPGSGKGTHTRFIMEFRDLTAKPIVVSHLLNSPEARKMIDAGMLVGDREVTDLVFRALLEPEYQTGAIVDGFPRTLVQVECLKMLYNRLIALRSEFLNTMRAAQFQKPQFHIVMLFVDERESVRRQLERGRQIREHNEKVRLTGVGELRELRKTDLDEEAAHHRYRIFKEKTYDSLKELREVFHYHFVNAHGSIEEVQQRIISELKYQSSLELDQKTYDRLIPIPVASQIVQHARQELINRLDTYEEHHTALFSRVVHVLDEKFMPIIHRHAIAGRAYINSEDTVFEDPLALAMLIDIFSERGYQAAIDLRREEIPIRIDPKTFEIQTRIKKVYRVSVHFQGSEIRRGT